jgi:hypothetical protein
MEADDTFKSSAGSMLVRGARFFAPVRRLLRGLHKEYPHGNRKLHYDEYAALFLLAYFQPTSQTLRWVQQASTLERVQRKLGISRTSLGSLSDASRLFDPEFLRRIFLQLAEEARVSDGIVRPRGLPGDLRVIAADGTLWDVLPKMARELWLTNASCRGRKGVFKGHLQFDILRSVPCAAQFEMKDRSEAAHLAVELRPGALYLLDRGFKSYELYEDILAVGSSFVVRLAEHCACEIIEERALKPGAATAGVQQDALVRLGTEERRMQQPLRLLRIKTTLPPPHNLHAKRKRGKHKAYDTGETREQELRLLTNRMDLDAETIALLYRYRWQIELFFRWFKCVLGSKHLMAHSENGLRLQMYIALIASLLVVVWTRRKPTQTLLNALNFYLTGWASWDELKAQIERAPRIETR